MARPKHLKSDKRNGFLNFRVPHDLDVDVTVLAFLSGLSGTQICQNAIREFVARYRDQIDKVKAVWLEVRQDIPTESNKNQE